MGPALSKVTPWRVVGRGFMPRRPQQPAGATAKAARHKAAPYDSLAAFIPFGGPQAQGTLRQGRRRLPRLRGCGSPPEPGARLKTPGPCGTAARHGAPSSAAGQASHRQGAGVYHGATERYRKSFRLRRLGLNRAVPTRSSVRWRADDPVRGGADGRDGPIRADVRDRALRLAAPLPGPIRAAGRGPDEAGLQRSGARAGDRGVRAPTTAPAPRLLRRVAPSRGADRSRFVEDS